MKIELDLGAVCDRLRALPERQDSFDALGDIAALYDKAADGTAVLAKDRRDAELVELDPIIERHRLKAEAARLRKEKHAAIATEAVTQALRRAGVREKLLPGARALFMSTHRIAVNEDANGNVDVRVVGKLGPSAAEFAAVQFVEDDGAAFASGMQADQSDDGGFAAELRRRLQ